MKSTIVAAVIVALVSLTGCQLPYTGGARPVTPAQLDSSWLRAAPTPVVRQKQESDCGLAALAMVAGAWGRHWSVDDLAHRIPPSEKGVKLGALRDLARDRGLDAFALRASTQDLQHELASGRPVLLGLMLPFDRGHNRSHYEVAVAMNPHDGTVVTIDPASGEWMRRSRDVLDLEWKAAGYPALVVTGDHSTISKE
ncbi:MAG: C39 family peptidase [Deltaproteobacteria bacterium]|nr:C39 family peptidase [Deltaproteobacteria bacterium]